VNNYVLLARRFGWPRFLWRMAVRQTYKRVLRRPYALRLPTGETIMLPPRNSFSSEVILTGADVDWGTEARFFRHFETGRAFVDVGAHLGYYALYLRPRAGEVHAFEPDIRTLSHLRANLDGRPGVTVHAVAVSDRAGRASFTLDDHAELSRLGGEAGARTHEVEVVTLDGVFEPRGTDVGGIKIDVEGADVQVLAGASRLVGRCQPLILTEATVNADLIGWCRRHGYAVFATVTDRETHAQEFRELREPADVWTKMLFLVPARLQAAFAAESAGKR
jgi:FkbM family methyltransferase